MKHANCQGLTLIELLVAVAIAGILGTGVFRLFRSFTKQNAYQSRINEVQNQILTAVQLLEKDFRMSGFGVPGNGVVPVLTSGNDSIAIFVNREQLSTTLVGNTTSGTTSISVAKASGIRPDRWICLRRSDTTFYRKIAGIDSSGPHKISFSQPLTGVFPNGSGVFIASRIEYFVDASTFAFVRKEGSHVFPIGSAIDTFGVVARSATGAALTANFGQTRILNITVGGRVKNQDKVFPILQTTDINIRNFL